MPVKSSSFHGYHLEASTLASLLQGQATKFLGEAAKLVQICQWSMWHHPEVQGPNGLSHCSLRD